VNLKEMLTRGYVKVAGRPSMQPVNKAAYHVALRGMGYNNGHELNRSGEEWFIRHVLRHRNPSYCLDIGANVGEYSMALLQHTHSMVYAFEPLPGAFLRLQAKANQLGRGRLQPINTAVGAHTGKNTINFGSDDSEHASLSTSVNDIDYVGKQNVNVAVVDITTLDDWSFLSGEDWRSPRISPIDFIKIDVEGYESQVLLGGLHTIRRFMPIIQIEMNLHQMMESQSLYSLWKILPHGYKVFQLLPSGMHEVDPRRPEPNTFCFGNFVFIPEGSWRTPSAKN
jgi:FkbM family methyltransferase